MSEEQYNELLKAYTKEVLANMIKAEGFDAPPTLERSGSEHRRAVTSSRP